MTDERGIGYGCGCGNNTQWIWWIVIILIAICLFCPNILGGFGGGCGVCRD